MSRLAAFAPAAVLLVLMGLFAARSLSRDPHVIPRAMVGKPLPDLKLARLEGGGDVRLRSVAAGPALVNFYASWCVECVREAAALAVVRAEGVKIVGIAYKDTAPAAAGFLKRYGDPYGTVALDPDGRAGVEFGLTGVPETYAVDARGIIRDKEAQPITAAEAERLIRAAGG